MRVSGGSDQPVVERYGRGGAPSEKNKEAADLVGSTASCCDRVAGAEIDGSDQLPNLHQDGGQRRGLLVELLQKFQ